VKTLLVDSDVKDVKVAVIGAGSMTFIANIARGLMLTESKLIVKL